MVYVTRHGLRTPLSDSKNTVSGFPWECLSTEETVRIFTEDVELHRANEGPERGTDPASIARSRLPPGLFEPVFSGDKELHFGKNCHAGQLTVAGHNVRDVRLAFVFWALLCWLFDVILTEVGVSMAFVRCRVANACDWREGWPALQK